MIHIALIIDLNFITLTIARTASALSKTNENEIDVFFHVLFFRLSKVVGCVRLHTASVHF